MSIVKQLLQQEISNMSDNIYRAKLAERTYSRWAEYGQSGRTLDEIITDYEKRRAEAQDALNRLGGE